MEGYQQACGREIMGAVVQGSRSITGREKIDRGHVKNSIEKAEATELTCTTHGHELRGGLLEGSGVQGRGGQRERKLGQL